MTHVVAPVLARNARILASMAAGLWIVSDQLVTVSQHNRCLVEPVRAFCPAPQLKRCCWHWVVPAWLACNCARRAVSSREHASDEVACALQLLSGTGGEGR